jgi:hypothetical protein
MLDNSTIFDYKILSSTGNVPVWKSRMEEVLGRSIDGDPRDIAATDPESPSNVRNQGRNKEI